MQQRYQIIDTIGHGDFATVYRGRDSELGRDVAIKQIHPQFLEDPRQLERYWYEAQVLASLEHPHIMTIYDVVREKGWLILELMQGSLKELLGDNPIDLKDLRLMLTYTLHALQFMHEHKILHGDIKPGNLMVDRNHRVKLGDFGIARHVQSDEGSVIKGTTRYIAPEVVSDQFGPVGPHSDLYSLGFTAYEFMCGSYFETLFPGLSMYGRDRQIAWMMWHSTADQRLPEVDRVLEGVPADLTHVIQKLTEKDPARRYRSAPEVLADINEDGQAPPEGPSDEELAAAEAATRQARRKRSMTVAALACSVVFSLGLLFLPLNQPEPPAPAPVVRPEQGTVVQIDLENGRFFLQETGGEPPHSISIDDADRVFVNDQRARLDDLSSGDVVTISYLVRDDEAFKEIFATRSVVTELAGHIRELRPRAGRFVVTPDDAGDPVELLISDAATVTLNGSPLPYRGRPALDDLRTRDRVTVQHVEDEDENKALRIDALRDLAARGFVDGLADGRLRIKLASRADGDEAATLELPLAADCRVTLNGKSRLDNRPLTLYDLRTGDTVSIRHDAQIHRVEAFRDVNQTGTLADINDATKSFSIRLDDGSTAEFQAGSDFRVEISGEHEQVDFRYLREGDRVTVQRRSPDPSVREAVLVAVEPRPDPRAWVAVIEQSEYDGATLPRSATASADARGLQEMWRIQYRVPENQILHERNVTRTRLERSLQAFFGQVVPDAQLLVYFVGHGQIDDGTAYLAPRGFDPRRPAATGIALPWLIEQMESCPAAEKILLLDTTHVPVGEAPEAYPSATELVETARPRPNRPVARTVNVIAGCEADEQGLAEDDQGIFAASLRRAFEGQADVNGDHRVGLEELLPFVSTEMARVASAGGRRQTPRLFPADPTPPRLSEEARAAILQTLGHLRGRYDVQVEAIAGGAAKLAPDQPEPHLVLGLVQLKHDRTLGAARTLEQVRNKNPDALIAYHALAWLYFRRGDYTDALEMLEKFVERMPTEAGAPAATVYADHVTRFAGQLVGFALTAAPDDRRLTRDDLTGLNDAVKARGPEVARVYTEGFQAVRRDYELLQRKISLALDAGQKASLQRDLRRLSYYVPDFDFEAAREYLLAGME